MTVPWLNRRIKYLVELANPPCGMPAETRAILFNYADTFVKAAQRRVGAIGEEATCMIETGAEI